MLGSTTQWVPVSLDESEANAVATSGGWPTRRSRTHRSRASSTCRALSGDVEKLGDDTVAGEHATHYRAAIDYARLAEKLPDSSEVRDKLPKLGTVPADVWIDDDDRVVKMHMTIDAGAFGAGTGTAEMTMEITDFGVPVDVQAPPEDETVDLFSLERSARLTPAVAVVDMDPVQPSVGWGVLHLFYRVDRARADADPKAGKRIVDAVHSLDDDGHQALLFAVLGHKADLGVMVLGPDLARLQAFQHDLAGPR